MARYLVLLHLASPSSRDKATAPARFKLIHETVNASLQECEAVLTSPAALGFAGVSGKTAREVWQGLNALLAPQDNLSVIELGRDIATTHPGLQKWDSNTIFLTKTDKSQAKSPFDA